MLAFDLSELYLNSSVARAVLESYAAFVFRSKKDTSVSSYCSLGVVGICYPQTRIRVKRCVSKEITSCQYVGHGFLHVFIWISRWGSSPSVKLTFNFSFYERQAHRWLIHEKLMLGFS